MTSSSDADAAFVLREDQRVVDVGGAQAVDFLHRILSQDVKGIPVGGVRLACFLTAKGKILADLLVWNRGAGRTLVLSRAAAERGLPALERYVIADDVVFQDPTPALVPALLFGPKAEAVCASAGDALRALGASLASGPFGAGTAWHLLVPAARVADAAETLVAAGALPGSAEAFDVARVDAGAPLYGAELDDRVLPNEAGLALTAVAWTKGCYLGQEPVVMAKHRGHPPTLLCRLRIDRDVVPARESPLREDPLRGGEAAVGRITTAVRVHGGHGVRALGFVRHGLAVVGTSLTLEDGTAATVDAVFA